MSEIKNNISAMSDAELRNAIKKIVEDTLKSGEIAENAHFDEDLKIDSIAKMELLMAFEDEFGVEIPDSEAVKLISVEKTAEYIKSLAK